MALSSTRAKRVRAFRGRATFPNATASWPACWLPKWWRLKAKAWPSLPTHWPAGLAAFSFRRTQIPLTERTRKIYEERLGQTWTEINGHKVTEVDRRDGLKLIFEGGSWVLVRIAGTEPKIRLYAEGRSSEEQRHLMHLVRQFFSQRRL